MAVGLDQQRTQPEQDTRREIGSNLTIIIVNFTILYSVYRDMIQYGIFYYTHMLRPYSEMYYSKH